MLLFAGQATGAAGNELSQLRAHLERAKKAEDKPAIVEISRRIIAVAPGDPEAWEARVSTQLELGDLDRCEKSLKAWAKSTRQPLPVIDDFWGDLLVRRKDYPGAERHWLAFLSQKPSVENTARMNDKLAGLCVTQKRWADDAAYFGKAIAARDSADRRVGHAVAFLHLHKWDTAYAEIARAQQIDPANSQLKEWLPRFERLQNFLSRIKALDGQIAGNPGAAGPLLDRARWLTLAELYSVALEDCQRAMTLQPGSMRARIQTGEAFLDEKQVDDAAAVKVGRNLVRGRDGHVADSALRQLAEVDAAVSKNPGNAEAFAARSRILRGLNQFVLALADAEAGVAADSRSAAAHCEAAFSLLQLNRSGEALKQAVLATELDPTNKTAWFCRGVVEAARADLTAAIASQTRSLQLGESLEALREREKCALQSGKTETANADQKRIRELEETKP